MFKYKNTYALLAVFICICTGSFGFVFRLGVLPNWQSNELSINQVANPGFEYKSLPDGSFGNLPLYWTKAYSGATSVFGISTTAKQGEHSVFITDTSSSVAAGLHSDPILVTPGLSYTLRGWGKRDSLSYAVIYLRFFAADNTQLLQAGIGLGLNNQWEAGSLTQTAPEGAAYARVLLYSGISSTGTCYFDSISLVLADEQIGDGGFSNATVNTEPENWKSYGRGAFAVIDDSGNNILRVSDTSSTLPAGACYYSSATPGTPYRLQVNLRKSNGSGDATIHLSFYTANHLKLSTLSAASAGGTFIQQSLDAIAPEGAAYAKIICSSDMASVGDFDFDEVSFTRNYGITKYAAPLAIGTGSGDSAANAAAYTSTALWSAVNSSATTEPVRVVLLAGDYNKQWLINGLGNATNHILIEGETPYAVNYSGTDGNYFIYITNSQNITFRHLHFTANEDPADLNLPYQEQLDTYDYLKVVQLLGGNSDIHFEGLSFVHLLLMAYAAVGMQENDTHDISWERCSWTEIGYDLYDHCIYNANDAYNLNVYECYFQDCAGVYLRYRAGSQGTVENSTFISTGNVPTGDHWDRKHWAFIQFSTFNSANRDEKLGKTFVFKNNSFTYEQTGQRGYLSPYQIYVSGFAPTSEPTFHLVPLAEGAIIADTTALTSTRNSLFETYFGINPAVSFEISGNTYSGCWSTLFMMNIYPNPLNIYWTVPPSEIESENTDLDKLMGLD